MAALEIKILAGAESKAFLVDLEKLIKRMEAVTSRANTTTTTRVTTPDDESGIETEEMDFTTDLDEEENETTPEFTNVDEDGEDVEMEIPPKASAKKTAKTTKAKAITTEELNEACRARLTYLTKTKKMESKTAFTAVKTLLKKHFKTETVTAIAEEDRARAMTILSDYKTA